MNNLYGFVRWTSFTNLPFPNRIYFHNAGLQLYENLARVPQAMEIARKDFIEHYKSINENLPEWVIAAVWTTQVAGTRRTILDVFEYRDAVRNWPGNPDLHAFNINGINKDGFDACGDTGILIGEEESFRRECNSLEQYFKINPFGIPLVKP